ncbi:MAG: hypothetical protein U0984_17435 [Prosthecobacter sp.]|nr:hypothetical protein [Prosthecobacter sp.]
MSKLSPEQLAKVEQWAADGASLNVIQDKLKAEFGITLTYMEARLLLLDIGVKIKDKPREPEKAAEPAPEVLPSEPETTTEDDAGQVGADIPPGSASTLTLGLDPIAIPGAMVSGKVTFSDGQIAGWHMDQQGRLGLAGVPPAYQPPKQDIPEFQVQLDRLLQQSGY